MQSSCTDFTLTKPQIYIFFGQIQTCKKQVVNIGIIDQLVNLNFIETLNKCQGLTRRVGKGSLGHNRKNCLLTIQMADI